MDSAHKDNLVKGIACGLGAFFLFAIMSASAKLLTDTHSVFEIAFYRSIIGFVPFTLYIIIKRRSDLLRVKKPITLFFRIFIGINGLAISFLALKYMPMADATLIFMSATLITPALAAIFLKEHVGLHRWGAIIIGLVGVAIIVKPTGDVTMLGIGIAVIAACTHASAQIFLRILKEENSMTVTYYFLFGGALLMLPFMFFSSSIPTPDEFLLFLTVGVSGTLAQICLAYALSNASASVISPLNFSGLLWAVVLDIMIWNIVPGWPIFAGGAIIIIAQSYIIYREKRAERLGAIGDKDHSH
jgi:drug/metabolite transporter (DMT)-like permease